MIDRQAIFDRVATHLLLQGGKATAKRGPTGGDSTCRYRGDKGTSCAIGCLIPDEFYHEGLEGNTVTTKVVRDTLERAGVIEWDSGEEEDVAFLTDLQRAHDGAHDLSSIYRADIQCSLREVAERYGLKG